MHTLWRHDEPHSVVGVDINLSKEPKKTRRWNLKVAERAHRCNGDAAISHHKNNHDETKRFCPPQRDQRAQKTGVNSMTLAQRLAGSWWKTLCSWFYTFCTEWNHPWRPCACVCVCIGRKDKTADEAPHVPRIHFDIWPHEESHSIPWAWRFFWRWFQSVETHWCQNLVCLYFNIHRILLLTFIPFACYGTLSINVFYWKQPPSGLVASDVSLESLTLKSLLEMEIHSILCKFQLSLKWTRLEVFALEYEKVSQLITSRLLAASAKRLLRHISSSHPQICCLIFSIAV